jgi:hypothetical protein
MIKLKDILNEVLTEKKLCPKGRAYRKRRLAAGEKHSAYLSGRAVQVCNGRLKEGDDVHESLRDWFKKDKWVRINTQGTITGPCGTMKKGNKTTRCLPRAKANSLTKAERAATSRKKAASNKQFVPNTEKAKVKLKELRQIIKNIINELLHPNEDSIEDIEEYDVESEQDVKEFVQFMREYKQPLCEAEYHGRKVNLGKPMQGDVKKFKVYVKNPKGKVVKVNFGFGGSSAKGKRMSIKKNNPERRKSFRARHNCDNPGPRTKARYWSCRKW